MLYALRDPISFVVLVLSFVVVVTVAGWTSARVGDRTGAGQLDDRRARQPDPRVHLDPFGAIAAALTGVGWWRGVPLRHGAQRGLTATLLAGPAVLLLLGTGLLVLTGVLAGRVDGAGTALLQSGVDGDLAARVALLAGTVHLYVGLLALVPLPPLDLGRLLFARAPQTPGWQKARTYIVEKNLGTVAVLVLLLLPLAGQQPLLLALLTAVGEPLIALLTGLP